jgi:preprotein translocase subunit SecG
MSYFIMFVLFVTAVFLILLVLVQRGKGGGLAGAFGGMGGQSAFGTKAGDLFTRVTIGVATFWIIFCTFTVWHFGKSKDVLDPNLGGGGAPPGVAAPAPAENLPGPAPSEPADKPADGGAPGDSSPQ